MNTQATIGTDILVAKSFLENGETVAIPTETVYGLAANGFDSKSVAKIFQVKERPFFDPLILHTNNIDKIRGLVGGIPDIAYKMAQLFWPGPLTLVLPKSNKIPDIATSGLPTVGVRIPNHSLTLSLLEQLDFPLAAPSANPFGYISPTTALHVYHQLGTKIPYILDGGNCTIGVESTIIGFEQEKPIVYRLGGLSIEQLEKAIGNVLVKSENEENPAAPGMLKSHYAPHVPLYRIGINQIEIGQEYSIIEGFKISNKNIGTILFNQPINQFPIENQFILSPNGDLNVAAQNLFSALRILDGKKLEAIISEVFPLVGLGNAINDRLRRAALKS